MDRLEADDLRRARETPPGVKLQQACELMALGLRMMRRNLQRRHPDATPEQIERLYREWLLSDH